MGRRTGRHTDSDTLGAVDQKVGEADRQDDRFLFRLVKIRSEIGNILVQVGEKGLFGDLLQTGLRVTHGGRAVPFDIAKIPVPVDQGQSLFKLLGHDHKGVVDGAVPVRVVFTHRVPHDAGAFSVGTVRPDPQLVHVVESTALDGL